MKDVYVKKTYCTIILVMILVINIVLPVNLVNAEDGDMNIDVVLVIDNSGSMKDSDTLMIATDTVSNFIDTLDKTCRMGFVVFNAKYDAENKKMTSGIVGTQPLISLSTDKNKDVLMDKIGELVSNEQRRGDTDISLGIGEAKALIDDNSVGRKKCIVLLSDGATHFVENSGTSVQQSKKDLDATLQDLKGKKIPVYTVGLYNENRVLSEEMKKEIADGKVEMNDIAKKTDAMIKTDDQKVRTGYLEVENVDELSKFVFKIISYLINGTPGKEVTPEELDKNDDRVPPPEQDNYNRYDIEIPNDSVFVSYIQITTPKSLKELNAKLFRPRESGDKTDFLENNKKNENIQVSVAKSYNMIKLYSPDAGTWQLYLNKDIKPKVTYMYVYAMNVVQVADKSVLKTGEIINISSVINEGNDIVDDEDLLKRITMNIKITGPENVDKVMTLGSNGKFNFEYKPEKEGTYTVQTVAVSNDDTLNKISKEMTFTVEKKEEPIESAYVHLELSLTQIRAKESVKLFAELKNTMTLQNVSDDNMSVITNVEDSAGNKINEIKLSKSASGRYEGEFVPEEKGVYKLLTVVTTGGRRIESNQKILTVKSMMPYVKEDLDIKLNSYPQPTSESFMLEDKIISDPDDKFDIEPINSEICVLATETDSDGRLKITLTGQKEGSETAVLHIKNQNNDKIELKLNITVESGTTFESKMTDESETTEPMNIVYIAAGAILLLVLIIYFIFRPKFGVMSIECEMENSSEELRMPKGKHRILLGQLYKIHHVDTDEFAKPLKKVVEQMVITAKKNAIVLKYNGNLENRSGSHHKIIVRKGNSYTFSVKSDDDEQYDLTVTLLDEYDDDD